MADFDLVQTDAQVQSILNDGQNMQGAGAQTTLTTESVLLKDVNGNYHKILKSSFTEAIRDTLAGLLVNNDKGTTINQIAAIANGDFGSITPANLASVLGVSIVFQKTNFSGTFSNVVRVSMSPEASITLLVTRNFYNSPAFAAIIQIGRSTAAYEMNVIVPSDGISFSFDTDRTNGNITIGHNNQGNGLGTIRITILQRSTGAKFIGEVDN